MGAAGWPPFAFPPLEPWALGAGALAAGFVLARDDVRAGVLPPLGVTLDEAGMALPRALSLLEAAFLGLGAPPTFGPRPSMSFQVIPLALPP